MTRKNLNARRALKTEAIPRRLAVGAPRVRVGKRCTAKSRSGEPCKAAPLHGKTKCAFHSGNRAVICGQRGGRRRAIFNPEGLEPFAAPKSAGDLLLLLAQTIVEVRSGKVDPRVANSISYVSTAFLNAVELSDLDARLRVLEGKSDEKSAK